MSKNLTEVDNYDTNITVPEDADDRDALSVEVPFQQLANRSLNHENRIAARDKIWYGTLTGTSVSDGVKFTMTEVSNGGGYSLSSPFTDLVAEPGIYRITVMGAITSADNMGVEVKLTSTVIGSSGLLAASATGVYQTIIAVTTVTMGAISFNILANVDGGGSVSIVAGTGRLIVERIS